MKKPLWSSFKQHKELYDKTNVHFKDKQKKERLWESLAATRNLCQNCEEVVQDSMYQIWQAHSEKVRTSSSEEHRTTDVAEGQF